MNNTTTKSPIMNNITTKSPIMNNITTKSPVVNNYQQILTMCQSHLCNLHQIGTNVANTSAHAHIHIGKK